MNDRKLSKEKISQNSGGTLLDSSIKVGSTKNKKSRLSRVVSFLNKNLNKKFRKQSTTSNKRKDASKSPHVTELQVEETLESDLGVSKAENISQKNTFTRIAYGELNFSQEECEGETSKESDEVKQKKNNGKSTIAPVVLQGFSSESNKKKKDASKSPHVTELQVEETLESDLGVSKAENISQKNTFPRIAYGELNFSQEECEGETSKESDEVKQKKNNGKSTIAPVVFQVFSKKTNKENKDFKKYFKKILEEFNINLNEESKAYENLRKKGFNTQEYLREFTYRTECVSHLINLFIIISSFLNSKVQENKDMCLKTSSSENKLLCSNIIPDQLKVTYYKVMHCEKYTFQSHEHKLLESNLYNQIIKRLNSLKSVQRLTINEFINVITKNSPLDSNKELVDSLKKLVILFDENTYKKIGEDDLSLIKIIREELLSCDVITNITQLSNPVKVLDLPIAMKNKPFMNKIWNNITKKFKDLPKEKVHNMRTRSLYVVIACDMFLMISIHDPVATKIFLAVLVVAFCALAIEKYYYKVYGVDKPEEKKGEAKKVSNVLSQSVTVPTLNNGVGKVSNILGKSFKINW